MTLPVPNALALRLAYHEKLRNCKGENFLLSFFVKTRVDSPDNIDASAALSVRLSAHRIFLHCLDKELDRILAPEAENENPRY